MYFGYTLYFIGVCDVIIYVAAIIINICAGEKIMAVYKQREGIPLTEQEKALQEERSEGSYVKIEVERIDYNNNSSEEEFLQVKY